MSNLPLLEVEDLNASFPGRGGIVHAVRNASFSLGRERLGIVGESGSGKSTLGRAIVCLTRPSAGHILHFGTDPFQLSYTELRRHRRAFQIVFQDPNAALDPRMTILQSVREPLGGGRGDPPDPVGNAV